MMARRVLPWLLVVFAAIAAISLVVIGIREENSAQRRDRCRALGAEASGDPACVAAWRAARERFLARGAR